MANFANLTAMLNLNTTNFTKGIKQATKRANAFAANLKGTINTTAADTKKAGVEFKDVARIVQGIMISKVFYGGLNAIRSATDAVWEFSKQLEYSQMVYSNLFGDAGLATEFINVLKDFSAVTPFDFSDTEAAAKRLLAYGIEYKNVMYVMNGVLAAATVQGTNAVIEPISRALGQIYTKGRLMNEEMRQLAEAGIPVYEILGEKLGLTNDQLRNLGRNAIPATTAINALVDGINERFGSSLINASKTTQGILSNIKDNALQLFSGMFEPVTDGLHKSLSGLGDFIAKLKEIQDIHGIGGVLEHLVPPELLADVRLLVVNLANLWDIVKSGLSSAFTYFKYLILAVVQAFNLLAPSINFVLGLFAAVAKVVTNNAGLMRILTTLIVAAGAAWLVYKVRALAAMVTTFVIKSIIAAVHGLVVALNFLAAHPVWALLALGVGILIGLSGASDKFKNSINKLQQSLTGFGGRSAEDTLLPGTEERAADLDKFNDALAGTSSGMDDLADSTGAAAKAGKGLLGFDEVFKLDSPDESGAGGIADGIGDLMEGLSGLGGGMDFEIPDFTDYATNFVDGLIEALGGKETILSAGIGGILGAAIGGILGGPAGIKIGAAIGAIAGWFWPQLADMLGLGEYESISLPIGTGLGAAIGAVAGGPLGAVVGGAIGTLVGWITGMFIEGFTGNGWDVSGLSLGLGTGIGAAIGMIAFGPVGALIGAAVGALVGWIVGLVVDNWGSITAWFKDVGNWFAEIGKKIGDFFVGLGGGIASGWDKVKEWFNGVGAWFVGIGKAIVGFFTGITDGVSDFFGGIAASLSAAWKTVEKFFSDLWSYITAWASTTFAPVIRVFTDIKNAVVRVVTDIATAVVTVFTRIGQTLWGILKFIFDLTVKIFTDIWTAVSAWVINIWNVVSTWVINIWNTVSTWFQKVWSTIVEIVTSIWISISEWFQSIWDVVVEKVTGIWTTVSVWFQAIWDVVVEKVTGAWTAVSTWFQAIWTTIVEKISGAWMAVSEWFQAIWDTIVEKISGAWTAVSEWFQGIWDTIVEKLSGAYEAVTGGIKDIYEAFTGWITDMWDNVFAKFFDWIDNGIEKLREFFGLSADTTKVTYSAPASSTGHAVGGVFNREHIARFAEGNKAEAIIPLENDAAMQPFVQSVSDGVLQTLLPVLATMSGGGGSQLRPLYVGTLVADEQGLKELNRKMQVIQLQESDRSGV